MTHTTTHQNFIATRWTESNERFVHDPVRAPRAPWCRAAGFLLALSVLALGSAAHANGKPNGTSLQGMALQSTVTRGAGPRAGRVEGDRLIGWLHDEQAEQARVVEVTRVAGDVVHATVHDGVAAVSRRVRLRPGALTGMRWQSHVCDARTRCAPVMYRIVSAAPDSSASTMPGHSSNHDIWLYEVEFTERSAPTADDWTNVCDPRPGARARGVLVNGRWLQDGSWRPAGYTFSCPGGVIAKCVRDWGYKPWKTIASAEHGEVSLLPLHLACIRAARADYCGDGISHTHDGTLIDMADRYGFNIHEGIAGFQDESAFGPDGAHWVRAPRWPTGRRVDQGWLFATCVRPSAERLASTERPLVYVQSKTSPGLR